MLTYVDEMKIDADVKKKVPFGSWQQVEVVFPHTPNTDLDIPHQLTPADPDQIGYLILRQSAPGAVYRGFQAIWTTQYIRLRSNVGGLRVTLLLFVPRTPFAPGSQDRSGNSFTSYTPTMAIDNGATLSSYTANGTYSLNGSTLHLEIECSFTVTAGGANGIIVTATLPINSAAARNTATNCRIFGGGAPVGYGVVQVPANYGYVQLIHGNGTQWINGTNYICWFQITYFI